MCILPYELFSWSLIWYYIYFIYTINEHLYSAKSHSVKSMRFMLDTHNTNNAQTSVHSEARISRTIKVFKNKSHQKLPLFCTYLNWHEIKTNSYLHIIDCNLSVMLGLMDFRKRLRDEYSKLYFVKRWVLSALFNACADCEWCRKGRELHWVNTQEVMLV